MKKALLVLGLLLTLPMASQASGCSLGDTVLAEEKIVAQLGDFDTSVNCNENQPCFIFIFGQDYESHTLYAQGPTALNQNQQLGQKPAQMYRQHYVGSCGDEVRYTIGVDINGVRYRAHNDIGN